MIDLEKVIGIKHNAIHVTISAKNCWNQLLRKGGKDLKCYNGILCCNK